MLGTWIARIIVGWIVFSFGILAGLFLAYIVAAFKERRKRNTQAEAFMCAVDFRHELGMTTNATYDSIESAIQKRKCVIGCGMVRVSVSEVEYYSPSQVEVIYWQMVRDGEIEAQPEEPAEAAEVAAS